MPLRRFTNADGIITPEEFSQLVSYVDIVRPPISRLNIPRKDYAEREDDAEDEAAITEEVDPDGESSSLCSGCRLPIFSTPYVTISGGGGGGDRLFLHKQCDRAPRELSFHELHPQHAPIVLVDRLRHPPPSPAAAQGSTPLLNSGSAPATAATCHNCKEICGSLFYQCSSPSCDFRLDLLCVLQLKIVHRSHNHSMTVIRQREASSLTCSACDTKHKSPPSSSSETVTLSYLCNLCGYWIHPHCASLLNSILHYEKHKHSLFLTYNLPTSTQYSKCAICSHPHKKGSGVFLCLRCPEYLVHIKCALKNHDTFKPVFIRDAKASVLARLPLANEHTSLIPYIRHDNDGDTKSPYHNRKIHPHPLILHETDDGDQPQRICNACIQSISPPFYTCDECQDFFLHGCCAHLPPQIKHDAHKKHRLSLYPNPKSIKSDNISAGEGFSCRGCHLRCNGFVYSCETCKDFALDVVCAMIDPAITHESHRSTHILFRCPDIKFASDEFCSCCTSGLFGICYKCSICPDFKLHIRCALLPDAVSYTMFDEHPLRLTATSTKEAKFVNEDVCEVCEERLGKDRWYYGCRECNKSFHVDCIPSIDQLSRIKVGRSVRVEIHGCPVALVRLGDAVCSARRCGSCREKLRVCDSDGLAYECSKCFFGLHQSCAKFK